MRADPTGLRACLHQADVQVPTLAPYLDLSLVRSVTLSLDVDGDSEDSFDPHNLDCACPTEFDLRSFEGYVKNIFVPYRLLAPGEAGPTYSLLKIHSLMVGGECKSWPGIWHYFDPVTIRIDGYPAVTVVDEYPNPPLFRWTRLVELTSVDTTSEAAFFSDPSSFGSGPVTVRWEISAQRVEAEIVRYVAEDLNLAQSEHLATVGSVIIQVVTQDLKEHFQRVLADSPLYNRTTILVKPAEVAS